MLRVGKGLVTVKLRDVKIRLNLAHQPCYLHACGVLREC